MAELTLIDGLAVAFVLLGGYLGYRRGLSGELARLFSVGVMLLVGWSYYEPIARGLAHVTRLSSRGAQCLAFVGICLGVFAVLLLMRFVLRRTMQVTFSPAVDRWGGLFVGMLKSSLIVAFFLISMIILPHAYLNALFGDRSLLGRLLRHLLPF